MELSKAPDGKTKALKILTWNIRSSQDLGIIRYIKRRCNADILILTEYGIPKDGDIIRHELANLGWIWQISSKLRNRKHGVLIASRVPIINKPIYRAQHRIVRAQIKDTNIILLGVYFPWSDSREKDATFKTVIQFARKNTNTAFIIAGDFNSLQSFDSQRGVSYSPHEMKIMSQVATDAWRASNKTLLNHQTRFTFRSNKSRRLGSRNDYIFISHNLRDAVLEVKHDHSARRRRGLSDHSAIIMDLKLKNISEG